jgi:hypothetical protein
LGLLHGQVPVGASELPLTSQSGIEAKQVVFKAPSTNTASVYFGNTGLSTSTGYPVEPGEEKVFTLQGLPKFALVPDRLYLVGTAGDKLAWLIFT